MKKLILFGGLALSLVIVFFAGAQLTNAKKPEPRPIYALVWHQTGSDADFQSRIPRLFGWLQEVYASGHLVGCGGGQWMKDSVGAGLTLIYAANDAEAQKLASGQPMNEIGTTEILQWDCFYGNLNLREREGMLKK